MGMLFESVENALLGEVKTREKLSRAKFQPRMEGGPLLSFFATSIKFHARRNSEIACHMRDLWSKKKWGQSEGKEKVPKVPSPFLLLLARERIHIGHGQGGGRSYHECQGLITIVFFIIFFLGASN